MTVPAATARRIEVLREGKAARAYGTEPAVSSAAQWPGEFLFEAHRLPPCFAEAATGAREGLIVNLGPASRIRAIEGNHTREWIVPKGGVFVGSAGAPIPAFESRESLFTATIQLSSDLLAGAGGPVKSGDEARLRPMIAGPDGKIQAMVQAMLRELEAGSPAGPLYGESLGFELAAYLRCHFSAASGTPERAGGLSRQRLHRVLDYMEANLERSPSLAELAQVAGASVFHFVREFRRDMGIPPHAHLLDMRMSRAKRLLASTNTEIAEVTRRTGFASASHFAAAFRKSTGQTPSAFRKTLSKSCY